MANVQYTENMTEEQLDARAESETLRYQATSYGMTRNNKALIKSTNRLRDSLLPKDEPKLAIPLLLLIAQHRSLVVVHADAPYIKMVSEQFDRCQGTLLQYVEFLGTALTSTTSYAQLVPSLEDLVHKYHIEPEVAFLIYRPVMRLFKSSNGSNVCWPSDDIDETYVSHSEDSEATVSSSELVLDVVSSVVRLRHPNIVTLVGYCMDHGQHLLVYQYVRNLSLENALHHNIHKHLNWTTTHMNLPCFGLGARLYALSVINCSQAPHEQ